MKICLGPSVHIPVSQCDDCTALENRVKALEELLDGVTQIPFSKTDTSAEVSGYFLGNTD